MKQQPNDSQLLDQMKKINERMYGLERKLDVLAGLLKPKSVEVVPVQKTESKVSSGPITPTQIYLSQEDNDHHKSHQHPHAAQNRHNNQQRQNHPNQHNQNNNRPKERTMYTTICADCKKSCEVPFKPTGDRPIYCKDCFSLRKIRSAFIPKVEEKPAQTMKEEVAAQVFASQTSEIVKTSASKAKQKKKNVSSKKLVVKKKPLGKKPQRKK